MAPINSYFTDIQQSISLIQKRFYDCRTKSIYHKSIKSAIDYCLEKNLYINILEIRDTYVAKIFIYF